jgi:hypothetical protein
MPRKHVVRIRLEADIPIDRSDLQSITRADEAFKDAKGILVAAGATVTLDRTQLTSTEAAAPTPAAAAPPSAIAAE